MKSIILFLAFTTCIFIKSTAQVEFQSYSIYCETISTEDQSNSLRTYLLNNFSEKITHYTADLVSHSAIVVCSIKPLDVLQLYRQLGHEAIYLDQETRYELSPDGNYLKLIKE